MANLSAQPGGLPGQPGAEVVPGGEEPTEVFDFFAQQTNMQKMERIRSFMGIISGCCAGILGLINWSGIIFFVVMHIVVATSLLSRMEFTLSKYRKGSGIVGFMMEGAQSSFLSFMLFWTLFYGLVYLF